MRTREEHIRWCKERAMEYLVAGDLEQAVASMLSDLSKHPETEKLGEKLGMLGIMYVANHDTDGVRRFIEGFRE
jgi:hypothetical protein